ADDDHRPALDPAAARDQVRGHEGLELALGIIGSRTGELPELAKGSRIEQLVDALAHRQPAIVAMALDLLRSAHLLGEAVASREFLELLFPGQVAVSRKFCQTEHLFFFGQYQKIPWHCQGEPPRPPASPAPRFEEPG